MKYTPMQLQRVQAGLTQNKVAATLGIGRSYLSQIETYRVPCPPEFLSKLIKLYNCDPKDLFPKQ